MNPTLFLDIDGVLVTRRYWADAYENGLPMRDSFHDHIFDPYAVDNFHKIVDKFDPDIVISSTWRCMGMDAFRAMWARRNMRGRIVGATAKVIRNMAYADVSRGKEIDDYVRKNGVDRYVILDDDSDMLEHQKAFFVKTTFEWGVTEGEARKVEEILK
jgi:hypothetical protein